MNDKHLEDEICKKNIELEELRDIKLKGAFIRSRSQMISQEEKPNKLFLNLENNNFISKNIKELINSKDIKITEPKAILEEMRVFYEQLHTKREVGKVEDSIFNNYIDNLNKLNNDESSKSDSDITINELYDQVFSTKNNKSPAPDGFTNEFFKTFWDSLKLQLLELMNPFSKNSHIPENFFIRHNNLHPQG